MQTLSVVLVVVLAVVAARALSRRVTSATALRWIVGIVAAVTIVVAGFHILGFIELFSGVAVVRSSYALAPVAALAALTYLLARRLPAHSPKPCPAGEESVGSFTLLSILTILGSVGVLGLLELWTFAHGYETQAYFLPQGVRLLREHTLGLWDRSFMHAYPANMSIFSAMMLAVLPERAINLLHPLMLGFLGLVVYALSRAADADRSASALIGAGSMTTVLWMDPRNAGAPDLAGFAFMGAAVLFVLAHRDEGLHWLGLAGCAAGIAFGMKSLHLIPIALLGLLLLGTVPVAWARNGWRALLPVGTYAVATLVMSSFWLARNWVELGNPLYPVHLPGIFDWLGWPAPFDINPVGRLDTQYLYVDRAVQWLIYPWQEGYTAIEGQVGRPALGAFVVATAPVAFLVWLIAGLLQPKATLRMAGRTGTSSVRLWLWVGAAAIVGAWWVLGDRQPRYALLAVLLLLPISAWLITGAAGWVRTTYEAVVGLAALLAAGLTVVEHAHWVVGRAVDVAWPLRHEFFMYPQVLDRLPDGATVLNGSDRPQNLAAFGENFRNRVIDIAETRRRFGGNGQQHWRFAADEVRKLDPLYLLLQGDDHSFETGECVQITEIGRLSRDPFSRRELEMPPRLLHISTCDSTARN